MMPKFITILISVILLVHGLIHLMGTSVYMKLGDVEGLSYKTTLLNGRWDLGEGGMRIFGALWILPMLGFAVAAVALVVGWAWWQPLLIAVSLISLVLTALDWQVAYAGAIVNAIILIVLLLGPEISGLLSG